MLMALIKKGETGRFVKGKWKKKSPGIRDLDFSGSTGFKILRGNHEVGLLIDRIQQVFFWIWILNWTVVGQRYIADFINVSCIGYCNACTGFLPLNHSKK
jgi:hypothetical protein